MIKVLIIEDEQPAAKRLEKMLAEIAPDVEITNRCDSIESSIAYIQSGAKPDLIFLDIQLGDGLSFDIFKQVEISCPIIFTTAYDEFAIRAFELNSIDYILKPVSKEKLEKSIEKYRKISQQNSSSDWSALASLLEKGKREYKQRFLVYVGEHLHSVQTSDIAYFYSVEKSTFLVSQAGKSYSVDFSLDKLETVVSGDDFFRINRNYLVEFRSIKKINILSKSRIKLMLEPATTDEILISTARTHDFREWLDR
ncbi:MAG: LytTR family DNA-binding domain-containing protein [Paludibacter sp.]